MDTQVVLTLVPSAARGPRKRRPSACGEIILSGPTKDDKAMQYSRASLGKLAGVALCSPRVLARHARCNRSQARGAICGGGRAPPAPPRAGSDPGCFSTVRVRTRQEDQSCAAVKRRVNRSRQDEQRKWNNAVNASRIALDTKLKSSAPLSALYAPDTRLSRCTPPLALPASPTCSRRLLRTGATPMMMLSAIS